MLLGAAPGRVYTTGSSAAPGIAWTTRAYAAPGRVYTTRVLSSTCPCLHYTCTLMDVSTPQGPQLHLNLPGQEEPLLLLDMSKLQRPELHLDVPRLQEPSPEFGYTTEACVAPGSAYTTGA